MRLLLVLALMVPLFAGCTGLGGDDPALATARQAQGPADRAAARWADDAVLTSASANELDDESRREFGDDMADTREELREARADGDLSEEEYEEVMKIVALFDTIIAVKDDSPGDGRAPVWFFSYLSEAEEDVYTVAVAKGQVIYAEADGEAAEEFGIEGSDEPLVDWSVDSDDAAVAASLNVDYTTLCGASNIVTFSELAQGDDGPVWFMGVERVDGDGDGLDEVFLAVDAVNGSLVQDEVIDPIEDFLFQESGEERGEFVALVQSTTGTSFEVLAEGHLQLAVSARISPAPLQPIEVTVTDPSGQETSFMVEGGQQNPFNAITTQVLPTAGVGTYEVTFQVPLSARSDWRFSFCTDGVPSAQGDFQVPACNAIIQPEDFGAAAGPFARLAPWVSR